MNLRTIKGIVAGSLATALLAGSAVFAAPGNDVDQYFIRSGKVTYPNGYISHYTNDSNLPTSKATFTMINEFDNFEFTVSHIHGVTEHDATVYVFLDDVPAFVTTVNQNVHSQTINVPLGNASKVTVEIVYNGFPRNAWYPFGQYTISDCKFN